MIFMMILIIMICSGCGNSDKVPRIDIITSHWRYDCIYLPLREGYEFAEVPYGIEQDSSDWYKIVIYCVKKK